MPSTWQSARPLWFVLTLIRLTSLGGLTMPPRTPKACRQQGCKGTTTHKHGYCDAHADKAVRPKWHGAGRGRGGRPWRRMRDRVKANADGLCERCRHEGKVTLGVVCDHIIPEAEGGTSELSNLQWLCKDCHDAKTAQESARARQRTHP